MGEGLIGFGHEGSGECKRQEDGAVLLPRIQ